MSSSHPNYVLVGSSSAQPSKNSAKMLACKFKNRKRALLNKILRNNAIQTLKNPRRLEVPTYNNKMKQDDLPSVHRFPKREPYSPPAVRRADVMKPGPSSSINQPATTVVPASAATSHSPNPLVAPAPAVVEALAPEPDVDLNQAEQPTVDENVVVFSVVVRSYTLGDVGVLYDIHSDETFEHIYKDYASRIDVKPSKIRLYKKDEYITKWVVAGENGIETGDVLFVVGLAGVVITCTRIKRFYIKNTGHRKKKKIQVQGKLDTPLCRLFHIWAKEVKVDPTNLLFMHEDNVLTTVHTISGAEIQNGDKIVALPNFKY